MPLLTSHAQNNKYVGAHSEEPNTAVTGLESSLIIIIFLSASLCFVASIPPELTTCGGADEKDSGQGLSSRARFTAFAKSYQNLRNLIRDRLAAGDAVEAFKERTSAAVCRIALWMTWTGIAVPKCSGVTVINTLTSGGKFHKRNFPFLF